MKICIILKEAQQPVILNNAFYSFILEDLERIGDFLFDILRLPSVGLKERIEICQVSDFHPREQQVKLENGTVFTLSEEIVEFLMQGYFVIFMIERRGMHAIIESPKWVKGLREERFFEFELIEDFEEPSNEEENFPGLVVRLSRDDQELREKIEKNSKKGILLFKYYPEVPNFT